MGPGEKAACVLTFNAKIFPTTPMSRHADDKTGFPNAINKTNSPL